MKEFDDSLDNINEAKKFSLEKKIDALYHLILLRYQSLTIISSIGFAVVGVALTVKIDLVHNITLALLALILLTLTALISLGRHLYLLRDDITAITKKIEDLPSEDWSKPLEAKKFKTDFCPETLYILLVIGIILFGLSLAI